MSSSNSMLFLLKILILEYFQSLNYFLKKEEARIQNKIDLDI